MKIPLESNNASHHVWIFCETCKSRIWLCECVLACNFENLSNAHVALFFFTCWCVLILCKSLHVMRLWWDLIESSTPCSKNFEKRIGMGVSKNVQTNWGTVASNNIASYGLKPTCSPTCYAEPFLLGGSAEHGESQDQRHPCEFFSIFELMVPWPFQVSSWTRRMFKESEP
jgi:hypothetical protein